MERTYSTIRKHDRQNEDVVGGKGEKRWAPVDLFGGTGDVYTKATT